MMSGNSLSPVVFVFSGDGFDTVFYLISVLLIAVFAVSLIRGVWQWHKNSRARQQAVSASVAAKRTGVIRGNCQSNGFATSSAWYCVTFQTEDGSQIELSVDSGTYSVIAEGDSGKLTYQGTRFLSFDRQ